MLPLGDSNEDTKLIQGHCRSFSLVLTTAEVLINLAGRSHGPPIDIGKFVCSNAFAVQMASRHPRRSAMRRNQYLTRSLAIAAMAVGLVAGASLPATARGRAATQAV